MYRFVLYTFQIKYTFGSKCSIKHIVHTDDYREETLKNLSTYLLENFN